VGRGTERVTADRYWRRGFAVGKSECVSETVTLARRFCGPPDSANGGYTAGVVAMRVNGAAEVTLRRPPPLEQPLTIERGSDGVILMDGSDLVAQANPTTVEITAVEPVDFDTAVAASQDSDLRNPTAHPFPTCFVCGPSREPGDGLRLFSGRVAGTDCFATGWVPHDDDPVMVWAALDCPSSAPIALADDHPWYVLGRLATRIDRLPEPEASHVIMSWLLNRDGRKVFTASALYDGEGDLCAIARATWIRLAGAP
jgi:hypothetical protein